MELMYKIQVGNFMLSQIFSKAEAEKQINRLRPVVTNEIKLVPVSVKEAVG